MRTLFWKTFTRGGDSIINFRGGFTLFEVVVVVGIMAVLTALVVWLPGGADNASVCATTRHLLKSLAAQTRTEALARRRTIVLRLNQTGAGDTASLDVTLVMLGDTPGEDSVLSASSLPDGVLLSEEDFPLNAALNEPVERAGSILDGCRAYLAFNRGGVLVSLSGEEARCNLRVRVTTETETSNVDFGVNYATGIVQETHFPARSQPRPPSVGLAGLDAETRGNWRGKYGASGMVVCNYYAGTVVEGRLGGTYDITKTYDFSRLPDYVADYAYTYDEAHTAAASWGAFDWGDEIMHYSAGHDIESGLLRPDGARMSSSVTALHPKSIQVVFTLHDDAEHLFSIYATENTPSGRYMTVVVEPLDDEGLPCGEGVFAQCTAEEYLGGIWFCFRVTGSFRVTIKNVSTNDLNANTFVSGFFFGEPEE